MHAHKRALQQGLSTASHNTQHRCYIKCQTELPSGTSPKPLLPTFLG
jgi:hypothetical protein